MGRKFPEILVSVSLAVLAIVPTGPAYAADSAASANTDAAIPVREFVKKPNMRTPRLSRDGTKLAFLAARDGREVLVTLDLKDPSASPKLVIAADEARESGDRTLGGYRWVGSRYLLMTVFLREDLGFGPGDFTRLIAYDTETGKTILQAWEGSGGSADNILYIDHDKGTYLLERTSVKDSTERWQLPEVIKVDIATGKYTTEQRKNPVVENWGADGKGVVRVGYSFDGNTGKFQMLYRSNADENFKTVYSGADKTFTERPPTPDIFVGDSDTAYVMSRKDGFNKVYKLDMKTMALSEPVYQTPNFDISDIVPNLDRTDIDGYETFDGENHVKYLNPDLNVIQQFMEEMFGAGQAQIVDYDKGLTKAIVYVGGASKNGGFYMFDTVSGSVKLLNWRSTALKDTPLNPVEAVWYTARDGTKIQAIVTYPRHRGRKNLPVVVMPHGGPFGAVSAVDSVEPWNQPLAEAGYLVIQPNYRGSGGYGKDFEQLGRKPDGYGVKMQDDLNDAIAYFGQSGLIDKDRACIMGWSYGGYAAARGAQRDAAVWKCAIAGAGVYDFPMMRQYDIANLGRFSSGFQATSNDLEGISSARHTDGKWAPILVVAGLRDQRIPIEQSRTLISRLKSSGKKEDVDFRYIEQKQGTHNLPYDDVHIQWIEEARAWLEKFNPAYIDSDKDKPTAH